MDKKAQKKIANRINHRTYTGFDRYDMEVLTGDILDDLEELGYRKLPKEKLHKQFPVKKKYRIVSPTSEPYEPSERPPFSAGCGGDS